MFSNKDIALQRSSPFLSMLPEEDYQSLQPFLEVVEIDFKDVIHQRGEPMAHVYFPCTAVLSVLAYMQNGAAVEVATIGNEGFSGIELLIGTQAATETCVCQIAGQAYRMHSGDFRRLTETDTPLKRISQRFLQAYLSQISQTVACNRLHTLEERFARWILMTHDRVGKDDFYLTQEFLADMLGVHRPSVSLVAGAFQQAGLLRYSRGKMTILNRAQLEASSCECYALVADQARQLLGLRRG
jgi:CRP-like cAMP-binding protein